MLNPMSVDWKAVAAGRVQVEFAAEARTGQLDGEDEVHVPQCAGIWLHDTPEKEKIEEAGALAEQRLRPP